MPFTIPIELVGYDGRKRMAVMTFEHSTEREFQLTVSRQAIKECQDKEKLREVAGNLLEGWAALQTAFQAMMKENLELRQAMMVKDSSLEAADALLDEAAKALKKYERQSKRASFRLWPFG